MFTRIKNDYISRSSTHMHLVYLLLLNELAHRVLRRECVFKNGEDLVKDFGKNMSYCTKKSGNSVDNK